MEYINQDQTQERVVKAKGRGQGSHGGQGLLAWLSFVKERRSGTSGFPVKIKGLRYNVSASVTAHENGTFDVSVSISGAGEMCQTYRGLSSELARDCLCDFNRRWRHLIDPNEEVEAIEYVTKRQKRKLEYTWIPPTSSWATPTQEQAQPTYYMTRVNRVVYEPEIEEEAEDNCVEYAEFTPYSEVQTYTDTSVSQHGDSPVLIFWIIVAVVIYIFLF